MSYSAPLPVGEPSVVPMGYYTATIQGEVSEQTSKFDSAKTYYTLPLKLQNREGEEFDFTWAFGPRSPVYLKFLEILGGMITPSGKINPPVSYEGKVFMIKLGEQMNKDKTRLVNSVLEVSTDNPPAAKKDKDDALPF